VNNLRYYTDDGWENKATQNLDRPLSEKLLFRTTLAAEWFEEENGVPHSLGFSLFQFLDEQKVLEEQTAFFFENRPSYRVTDVQLRCK
jgi:hypothetical protein